jgi:voltage-gated potassium channel
MDTRPPRPPDHFFQGLPGPKTVVKTRHRQPDGRAVGHETSAGVAGNRSMERQLEQLTQHVIVMGFGPLGQLVAQRLKAAGDTVIIIERLADLAAQASELGYLVLQADAGTDDVAPKRAGADNAKAFVVTNEDPDRKVAVTLLAHSLNPKLKIAVTGANRDRGALLHREGASEVIIADDLIAGTLVSLLGDKGKADK